MLEVFGPDGLIAKAHPEYEYRPGQIDMARAVMRAFEDKRHLNYSTSYSIYYYHD